MFKVKIIILSIVFLFISNFVDASDKITIGISKGSGSENYEKYGNWLLKLDSNIIIIDFYKIGLDSAIKIINICDGLLLSGGPDIHPNYYNRPEDEHLCSIDSKRDTLEFELIRLALKHKVPIFGICRGLQILNVALGGTLIADIPTQYQSEIIHQEKDSYDVYHSIEIQDSDIYIKLLRSIPSTLLVNSNHHQAVGKLSKQLKVLATSPDGIIEMFTWKKFNKKPFLLAVQWHPERLSEINPELSDRLGLIFIKEIKKNKKRK